MEKYRSRKFCLLLYPLEDETHKKAIEYIKLNYDYALIVHDKDIDEEGSLKKIHTHVVISCQNAKWNSALAEELGIAPNYLAKCRNFENALEYLIHYNDNDKYGYDIDDVQGNLASRLKQIILNDGKDENTKAYELIDYIENYEGYIDICEFSKYCCSVGMWDVYRRASYLFIRIIDKHNFEFEQRS